jgi:hypothetical protein
VVHGVVEPFTDCVDLGMLDPRLDDRALGGYPEPARPQLSDVHAVLARQVREDRDLDLRLDELDRRSLKGVVRLAGVPVGGLHDRVMARGGRIGGEAVPRAEVECVGERHGFADLHRPLALLDLPDRRLGEPEPPLGHPFGELVLAQSLSLAPVPHVRPQILVDARVLAHPRSLLPTPPRCHFLLPGVIYTAAELEGTSEESRHGGAAGSDYVHRGPPHEQGVRAAAVGVGVHRAARRRLHLVFRGPHGGTLRVVRSLLGRVDAAVVDKAARIAEVDPE